jgi:hypothetical protein
MLHHNTTDLAMRLDPVLRAVGEVPFDGVLIQAGEVFFKVSNYGKTNFTLAIPHVYGHSPYFAMHLTGPVWDSHGRAGSRPGVLWAVDHAARPSQSTPGLCPGGWTSGKRWTCFRSSKSSTW